MTFSTFCNRFSKFIRENKEELLSKFVTQNNFPPTIWEDRQCWYPLDEELIYELNYLDYSKPVREDFDSDEEYWLGRENYFKNILVDFNIHVQYYNFFSVLMNNFLSKYPEDSSSLDFFEVMWFCLNQYQWLINGTEFEQKIKLIPKFFLLETQKYGSEPPFITYFLERGTESIGNWKIRDTNGVDPIWKKRKIKLKNLPSCGKENDPYFLKDGRENYYDRSGEIHSEKDLENYLVNQCNSRNWVCEKQSPSLYGKGIPDRRIIKPDGSIVYAELKSPSKEWIMTGFQYAYHEKLREKGYPVKVIWSKDQVDKLLNE